MPKLKLVNVITKRRDEDGDSFPQIRELNLNTMAQTPIDLFQRFFKGTPQEYKEILARNNVTWEDFEKIKTNPTLFSAELNNFVMRLHQAIKSSEHCDEALRNFPTGKLNKSMANLESVTYDFSSFSQEEYDVISQYIALNYRSPSMIALLNYDHTTRSITTYTSMRGLYVDPFTHALSTSIGKRDKGEVSPSLDGTPSADTGLERKNWVMLEHLKLFIEASKAEFENAYSLAFKTPKHHKTYFESDVLNQEPDVDELFVKQIVEHAEINVKADIPRGSLPPDSSEKIINKLQSEIIETQVVTASDDVDDVKIEVEEIEKPLVEIKQENTIKLTEAEIEVEEIEKTIELETDQKTQAYFIAKRKQLEDAEVSTPRAVEVFKEAMLNGADLLRAFDMVDQTFKNNPYIREAVATEIKNEFLGVVAKENVIFGLKEVVASKNSKIEEIGATVTLRDNEVRDLLKRIDAMNKEHEADVVDWENNFNRLKTDLETKASEVDNLLNQNNNLVEETVLQEEKIKVLEKTATTHETVVNGLNSKIEILDNTIKSKEDLLKTQISKNELLEQNNQLLKDQLEQLKSFNEEKEKENTQLKKDLEDSKKLLQLAKDVSQKTKENERIQTGIDKNAKRAKYLLPIDKEVVKALMENAPDGSLELSRLRLVKDGKIDFAKFDVSTDEAKQRIASAKEDFDALADKGLLVYSDGNYTFKDEQSKGILFHMNSASIEEIGEEHESLQYKEYTQENNPNGTYKSSYKGNGSPTRSRNRG